MENSMKFLKELKIELPYNPAIPLLGIYLEKNENTNSERHMDPNVHSSTIYNSQDMEATQVSVNRHITYIYYIHNRVLVSHKRRMKFCHLQQRGWT